MRPKTDGIGSYNCCLFDLTFRCLHLRAFGRVSRRLGVSPYKVGSTESDPPPTDPSLAIEDSLGDKIRR